MAFDQRTTDMVMLFRFMDVNRSWVASSTNCDFSIRPIYGLIQFNVLGLSTTRAFSFQLAVLTVVILSLSLDSLNGAYSRIF
jgi:hypothetical protein